MTALAYRNYLKDQDGYLCCACVLRDKALSEYATLFFVTASPEKVGIETICKCCGESVCNNEAVKASERIAEIIEGETE